MNKQKRTYTPIKRVIPPPPAAAAQPPQYVPPVIKPSFMSTVAEGFAFGSGSALAREAVGGLMTPKPEIGSKNTKMCDQYKTLYGECIVDERKTTNCDDIFEKLEKLCQ